MIQDTDSSFYGSCTSALADNKPVKLRPASEEAAFHKLSPRISWLSHLYSGDNPELAKDLFQEGCLGLLNAYQNFRSNGGASFTTFANRHIRGRILNYLRGEVRYTSRHTTIEDVLVRTVEGTKELVSESETLPDIRADERFQAHQEWHFVRPTLRRAIALMTTRQRQVFEGYFLEQLTCSELADELSITPPRVVAILHDVRLKLQLALGVN
ncbi:MAG TPA: sigma-70 family RNA polymerase sigma factor [Chthoniobacterales bacterium]|nr:sigma-70 family RNA polymerase sigma factor [Chthoniobacterales bacterium]